MSKRKQPETSLDAYHSLDPNKLREVYQKVVNALALLKEGSMEDIAKKCGLPREKVWKRLPELCRMDLISKTENKRKLRSGASGFTYILTEAGRQKVTEKTLEGETISDFSKKLIPQKNKLPITTNSLF